MCNTPRSDLRDVATHSVISPSNINIHHWSPMQDAQPAASIGAETGASSARDRSNPRPSRRPCANSPSYLAQAFVRSSQAACRPDRTTSGPYQKHDKTSNAFSTASNIFENVKKLAAMQNLSQLWKKKKKRRYAGSPIFL